MITIFSEFINESKDNNYYIEMWNNYLKIVDIIDGIISEVGELSNRYWKDNIEDELNDITSDVSTVEDIINKEDLIKSNAIDLIDGLNGMSSEGKSISRYGSLSDINISFFENTNESKKNKQLRSEINAPKEITIEISNPSSKSNRYDIWIDKKHIGSIRNKGDYSNDKDAILIRSEVTRYLNSEHLVPKNSKLKIIYIGDNIQE